MHTLDCLLSRVKRAWKIEENPLDDGTCLLQFKEMAFIKRPLITNVELDQRGIVINIFSTLLESTAISGFVIERNFASIIATGVNIM